MKIAIKFGDNDFYNCFYGILETIKNAAKWNNKITQNKEQLCKIINEISYGLYLLYQNSFKYNEEKSGNICKKTKEYLQITPDQILINEEVTKYLLEFDGSNAKLFKQEEKDIATKKYTLEHYNKRKVDVYIEDAFKAGISYAESKFEEIAIEFVNYCDDNYLEGNTNFKELFQQFITQRNKKLK